MTARVFEAGTNVGGTWYWNRYPGARFDSESWTYGKLPLQRSPTMVAQSRSGEAHLVAWIGLGRRGVAGMGGRPVPDPRIIIVPFKANQDRRHYIAKQRVQTDTKARPFRPQPPKANSPLEKPGFEPLVPLKGFGLLCGEKRDREAT
jgi:hypothetical protein